MGEIWREGRGFVLVIIGRSLYIIDVYFFGWRSLRIFGFNIKYYERFINLFFWL